VPATELSTSSGTAATRGRLRSFRLLHDLTSLQRVNFTKRAVVLGFAAGIVLSPKLWVSMRYFPLIPIMHGMPALHFPVDYICAAALLVLLGMVATSARPRPYICSFGALLVLLALGDQTRWQPWVYLYLFLLLSLSCYSWRTEDLTGQQNTLNLCRLIIAATYFYSGLQKLNPHFASVGLISLLGPRAAQLPLEQVWPWIMGGIEASLGVALLTRRLRNAAVACGLVMHAFILFSGIVIMRWNSVVWPWNLAMMSFLVLLFWNSDVSALDVLWRNPLWFQKVALLLFGVMPALSFFGLWDSYLSASLYSANLDMANVVFREGVTDQLPASIRRYTKPLPDGGHVLVLRDWAVGELNVMPYPALRAYRVIGQEMCRYTNNSPDMALVMRSRDTLLAAGTETRDTCLGTLLVRPW
jgi:hypothetical protein